MMKPLLPVLTLVLMAAAARSAPEAPRKVEPLLTLTGHSLEVCTVACSPDGKLLASASNKEVKVWDAMTGKEVFTYPIKGTNVFGLAFSPDGKRLAVAITRTVKMLNVANGQEVSTITNTGHCLFRIAFSPDGKHLAASCGSTNNKGDVRVWEADTGRLLFCLEGHANAALNVAYSADGRLLASAGGTPMGSKPGTVKIWEAGTGRDLLTLEGHPENILGLAFSPDGRRLASASGSRGSSRAGTIKLWEVASGQEYNELGGHTGPIFCVLFSPDGRRLATASGDKTIKLWEFLTGQEVLTIPAHTSTIYSLAFSPDGRRLVSSSQDRMVKVWDISSLALAGPVRKTPPTAEEMEALWSDLASTDARRAHRGLGAMTTAPNRAIPWLRNHIHPVPRLKVEQVKQVAQWLRELDDDGFEVREKAGEALAKLGEAVLPALRRAFTGAPSPEARRRIGHLLEDLAEVSPGPGQLASLRALEVLELISSADARALLKALAAGLPEARLTREAQATLVRLAHHAALP